MADCDNCKEVCDNCKEVCENTASNYTCPNCHNTFCYECLIKSAFYNDNKCLCPICYHYEFIDIDKISYDLVSYSSNSSPAIIYECVICYEPCHNPIKCETCHNTYYCQDCFKKLIEKKYLLCGICRQPFSKQFIKENLNADRDKSHKLSKKHEYSFPF